MYSTPFSTEVLKTHRLFYILRHLDSTSGELQFYIQTTGGKEPFTNVSLFEMNNNKLLVAFEDQFKNTGKYNLIASNGTTEEIVPLQSFERVWDYYNKSTSSSEGFFVFMNSVPVNIGGLDWRCDNAKYGPLGYNVGRDHSEPMLKTLNQIRVYEPVISVNSVGHVVYAHVDITEDTEDYFINGNPIPFYGRTLSEVMKQVSEWALTAEEPFNNTEEMSLDCKEFIEKTGFAHTLVDEQVDMQVFEYLKGNENARVRPTNTVPDSPQLLMFVKNNIAYSSLSALLTLHPDAWDAEEVLAIESAELLVDIEAFVRQYIPETVPFSLDNTEDAIAYATDVLKYNDFTQFLKLKLNYYKVKKRLLDRLVVSLDQDF